MAEEPAPDDTTTGTALPLLSSNMPEKHLLCSSYPDFASVCLFIEQFGELLGLHPLDIHNLQQNFEENSSEEEGTALTLLQQQQQH